MDFTKHLEAAGVKGDALQSALACLAEADARSDGLTAFKLKVRLLEADKLAKRLAWEDMRLIDVDPSLLAKDLAPARNITIMGDFLPWADENGPSEKLWLNKDPESAEYKEAVAANKWTKGEHPRSFKSHKGAIRRNGAEGRAWELGRAVSPGKPVDVYQGDGYVVCHHEGAWELYGTVKRWGCIPFKVRVGYEIDNVIDVETLKPLWVPLAGYELRAPVTWSVLPAIF